MGCKTISCYSYKGGTGRSTGAANIAACFSGRGKKTMLIDLDIEAPGLHHILGLPVELMCKYGIQDYLREPVPDIRHPGRLIVPEPISMDELLSVSKEGGVIDVGRAWSERDVEKYGIEVPQPIDPDQLLFLPAKERGSEITFREATVEDKFRSLLREAASRNDLDFIFIDSASGIRSSSILAMAVSDLVLVFFRWTRQHLEGMKNSVGWIERFRKRPGFNADYILVASGVPNEAELQQLGEESQTLLNVFLHNREKLKETLGKKGEIDESNTINEILALKWQESVIAFEPSGRDYQEVTDLVLGWASEALGDKGD